MGDINHLRAWRTQIHDSIADETEIHYHEHCTYKYMDGWIIVGTNIHFRVLIRICWCGGKHNKADFLKRTEIGREEYGDGVEIHLAHPDQKCQYIQYRRPDNSFELKQLCTCPRR